MNRVGILLVGGKGTRLYPSTEVVNKHLLPIYNKPMVYYSLSLFLSVGIKEIVVIVNEHEIELFRKLFSRISLFGIEFSYVVQRESNGIAESLILSEQIISGRDVMLVLGDNIIYGSGLQGALLEADQNNGATIFGYPVKDASRFGVVYEISDEILSIEEKPAGALSNLAVPGIYFYDHHACQFAKELSRSGRGELEITDLNRRYLTEGLLRLIKMGRGTAWFDTGTPESIMAASNFVYSIETNQGLMVACLEELILKSEYIEYKKFRKIVANYYDMDNWYDGYVRSLII